MPLPNLVHPINVTIQKSNKASTVYDADAREPIRVVRREAITISAQVSMRRTSPDPETGGLLSERVAGYLIARVKDLDALSYSPKIGDKITTIGHRSVDLYLSQVEDLAHYPGQNGATLLKIYFEDRRPASDSPSMV
mgnify:CR=1 FL=1